jgi:hypothetical protein
MALPDGYDPFEYLQDYFRKISNKEVKEYFSDLGENWEPSLEDGRSRARVACTHLDNDTATMSLMRTMLFYMQMGYFRNDLIVFPGEKQFDDIPVTGHPIIHFYFSQDSQAVPEGESKLDAEYSVRLMQLTNTSTNLKAKLIEISNEIKVQFVDARKGILLNKGNLLISYKDVEHGFPKGSKILCNTEADAIDIYQRMCNVIDVPFDELNITKHDPKKPSTNTRTKTQVIMGKTEKLPRHRPIGNVRFRHARCKIPGKPGYVYLVDTTYRYNALVSL